MSFVVAYFHSINFDFRYYWSCLGGRNDCVSNMALNGCPVQNVGTTIISKKFNTTRTGLVKPVKPYGSKRMKVIAKRINIYLAYRNKDETTLVNHFVD